MTGNGEGKKGKSDTSSKSIKVEMCLGNALCEKKKILHFFEHTLLPTIVIDSEPPLAT